MEREGRLLASLFAFSDTSLNFGLGHFYQSTSPVIYYAHRPSCRVPLQLSYLADAAYCMPGLTLGITIDRLACCSTPQPRNVRPWGDASSFAFLERRECWKQTLCSLSNTLQPVHRQCNGHAMDCNDSSFGPSVHDGCRGGFDFTLLFEESILMAPPVVAFLCALPVRLQLLLRRRRQLLPYRDRLCLFKLVCHFWASVQPALIRGRLLNRSSPALRSACESPFLRFGQRTMAMASRARRPLL